MKQQTTTFNELFGHVTNKGGVYWCEDLHTSYWKPYGGGYKTSTTFIETSKTWIDKLNAHHSKSPELRPDAFTENVHGIHYYDSVVVIEKQIKRAVIGVARGYLKPAVRPGFQHFSTDYKPK